jgi:hypothetical protein
VADLHIVCLRPGGMNRGGLRHDRHQVHQLGSFTPVQLREMLAEPELALILGGDALTEAHVAGLEAPPAKKAKG